MAVKTIKVSDLSGELILDQGQLGRLVVEEYPGVAAEEISLDVLPEEVEGEIPEGQDSVVLSYQAPGAEKGRRFVLPLETFNKLSKGKDMDSILKDALATEEKGRSRRRGTTRTGVNYASPEHAGEPHRGRATQAEQEYVRTHLGEVNARLRRDGMREIDPNDPKMANRYGLTPALAA
jgi:hypothetical protein